MSLLQKWQLGSKLTFGVYLTKCIVNDKPSTFELSIPTGSQIQTSLIVPTNPTLTSTTLFPYFKRGFDTYGWWTLHIPPDNYKNASLDWKKSPKLGGIDAKQDMLYPLETIDGIVHLKGGTEYHKELEELRNKVNPKRRVKLNDTSTTNLCTPYVIQSRAFGQLKFEAGYDILLHVAPPVYRKGTSSDEIALAKCYTEAFSCIFSYFLNNNSSNGEIKRFAEDRQQGANNVIYTPLIGAGCRNWPIKLAANVAIDSIQKFSKNIDTQHPLNSSNSNSHIGLVVIDELIGKEVLNIAQETFC